MLIFIKLLTLLIFIFGFYTRANIQIFGTASLYCWPTLVIGMVYFFMNISKTTLIKKFCSNLALTSGLYLIHISLMYIVNKSDNFPRSWLFIYIISNLSIFGCYLELRKNDLKNILYYLPAILLSIVLLGCILEINFVIVQEFSQKIAFIFNPQLDFAFGFDRDIEVHGGYRPRFFTQEPSHLAFNIVVGTIISYCSGVFKSKLHIYFIYNTLAFVIIRSPVILVSFPVGVLLYLVSNKKFIYKKLGISIMLILLISPFVVYLIREFISIRFDKIVQFSDLSGVCRIWVPGYLMYKSFSDSFVFGFGLPLSDYALNLAKTYISYIGFLDRLTWSGEVEFIKNSLFAHFIYFGFIYGTILLIAKIKLGMTFVKEQLWIVLIVFSLLSFGVTSYFDSRLWITFIIVCLSVSNIQNLEQK